MFVSEELMKKLSYVLAVAMACMQVAASLYIGCSPGTHRVISYDYTLVPPSGVRASSEDTLFNPDDNLFHRNNIPLRLWCSQSFEEAMRDEEEGEEGEEGGAMGFSEFDFENFSSSFYIHVNFTKPLLLTHIITSGFSNGYVNNFTLGYSLDSARPLQQYAYSDTTQEFISDQIDTVFQLSEPIAALRIRFNINNGLMTPSGRLCWHLTLLGCTLPEALNETVSNHTLDAPTLDLATAPSPVCQTEEITSSQPSTPSSTSEEVEEEENEEEEGGVTVTAVNYDPHLLAVLIPTSAAIVLVLVVLIILVGVICTRCSPGRWRKGSNRLSTDAIANADTLGMVDNELYRSRSSIFPISINHTGAMAIDKNAAAAQNGEALYENCNSDPTVQAYSSKFPHFTENSFYESISPRNPAEMEQSIGSMVDNPNYSIPFPLNHHPLDTTKEEVSTPPPLPQITPRVMKSRIGGSAMDMVDNECYSAPPSASQESDTDEQDLAVMGRKGKSCVEAPELIIH